MEKETSYNEVLKKAIYNYRNKNKDKYNEIQRNYYNKMKQDEEWKKKFNERCKIYNKKRREKIKNENSGKKGRPKKLINFKVDEVTIPEENISLNL
jgi:hypothetical protein